MIRISLNRSHSPASYRPQSLVFARSEAGFTHSACRFETEMRTQTPVPARAINSAAIDLENLATLSRTPPTCGSVPLEPGKRIE